MYAQLEWHVRVAQVSASRDKGIAIHASLVGVVAKEYLQDHGARDLLLEHGRLFKAGSTWCLTLLKEMGLSRCKCTTQAAKLPQDWEEKGRRLTAQVNTNYNQSHAVSIFFREVFSWPVCGNSSHGSSHGMSRCKGVQTNPEQSIYIEHTSLHFVYPRYWYRWHSWWTCTRSHLSWS